MARTKKKPNFDEIGNNPFAQNLVIKINRKRHRVLNKFEQVDKMEVNLDAGRGCKVFEIAGYKALMMTLPIRAKELYLYLIHSLDDAQDYIWIDRVSYMKAHGIKSVNTFKDAVKALEERDYILQHHYKTIFKDVYWINPRFLFKGSRPNKYPKNWDI